MDYRTMSKSELIERIQVLEKELQQNKDELERLKGKNPRGAGRKFADEKWAAGFAKFINLHSAGKSAAEVMAECGISRSTYFRYKKLYNDTSFVN